MLSICSSVYLSICTQSLGEWLDGFAQLFFEGGRGSSAVSENYTAEFCGQLLVEAVRGNHLTDT